MNKIKRSWDLLSDEQRKKATKDIVDFFQSERNETIGVIAAETVLDFMLQTLYKDIYNKGVDETYTFFKEQIAGMETDINALVKK